MPQQPVAVAPVHAKQCVHISRCTLVREQRQDLQRTDTASRLELQIVVLWIARKNTGLVVSPAAPKKLVEPRLRGKVFFAWALGQSDLALQIQIFCVEVRVYGRIGVSVFVGLHDVAGQEHRVHMAPIASHRVEAQQRFFSLEHGRGMVNIQRSGSRPEVPPPTVVHVFLTRRQRIDHQLKRALCRDLPQAQLPKVIRRPLILGKADIHQVLAHAMITFCREGQGRQEEGLRIGGTPVATLR